MAPQEPPSSSSLEEPLLLEHHHEEQSENEHQPQPPQHDNSHSKDISFSCCRNKVVVNHNVFLNLVLAVLYGISGSLSNGTAFAAYLKTLGRDRNGPLGDIEAVSGMATLITALPIGYLADKIGRSKVIAAGGCLLLLTPILEMVVLEWVGTNEHHLDHSSKHKEALWILGIIMASWGVGDGIVNGPCSALYADSTPQGQRSIYYNYLFACYTAASAVGPLVSIGLFQTLGDEWDLYHLRIVIYVGLGIEVVNSLLMMFFDDNKALEENKNATNPNDNDSSEEEEEEDVDCEAEENVILPEEEEEEEDEETNNNNAAPSSTNNTPSLTPLEKRQLWIPYIVFAQGLIFALGSGMTVKFFPLFFKDQVGMSPSQVQIIYTLVPFVMIASSTVCSKMAQSFGRAQTTLLFSSAGVLLLYSMVIFQSYLDLHPFLLVPIYVFRTSFMNATYPLQESILMDFVPKEERARWKSLDSVAAFGWCGSAAFGGWLADQYDYTFSFLITAIVQTVGVGVWALLLPLVPRHEGGATTTTEEEEEEERDQSSNSLQEPLLANDSEGII